MSTVLVNVPAGNTAVSTREGFGEIERRQQFETAASAVAAREQAVVQARYIVALQRPRDIDTFRVKLLKECDRPGFAEDAEYARPVGREKDPNTGEWRQKIARGPTIRLIETALRYFGNAVAEAPIIFENPETRIVRAQMTDLESNITWMQDIVLPRRIEKRAEKNDGKWGPPKGREIVGERVNSEGHVTYLVTATDDELSVKQSALVSKAQRKNAERLLPSDIIHEALAKCRETREKADKQDPDAARKKIIDSFSAINIQPSELVEYLGGRPLDRIQPADLKELRMIYTAIRDGEATWAEFMQAKDPAGSADDAAEVGRKKIEMLRRQAESKQEKPAQQQHNTPKTEESGNSAASAGSQSPESATPAAGEPPKAEQPPAETTGTAPKPKLQFGKKQG